MNDTCTVKYKEIRTDKQCCKPRGEIDCQTKSGDCFDRLSGPAFD